VSVGFSHHQVNIFITKLVKHLNKINKRTCRKSRFGRGLSGLPEKGKRRPQDTNRNVMMKTEPRPARIHLVLRAK